MNTYVLPYHVTKSGRKQILLGFKKIYTYDGAVFNNPNQDAILGGQANRGEKRIDGAIREFREETGIKLEKDNITHNYATKDYIAYYYKVEDKSKFMKINTEDKCFDTKIVELMSIEWCDFTESKYFMKSEQNMNPIDNEQIIEYMDAWRKGRWSYNNVTASFKKWIRNNKKFEKVIHSIQYNGSKSFYCNIFAQFFKEFINRKQLKNEWFYDIVMNLE